MAHENERRRFCYGYRCTHCGRVVRGIDWPRISCQECGERVDCRPMIEVAPVGRAAFGAEVVAA